MANSSSSSGIGFCGMLFFTFLILKLCKVITWSWIWVFAPLWIGPVVAFSIFIIVMVLFFLIALMSSFFNGS